MEACLGSNDSAGGGPATELIREGVLTRMQPSARAYADIRFALPIVRRLRELDLGPAIAIKEREVIAVETLEGLEAMTHRAGGLCAAGRWILVKTGSNGEGLCANAAVDVATIRAMKASGASCLALVAHCTLMADKAATIVAADEARIAIVGVVV